MSTSTAPEEDIEKVYGAIEDQLAAVLSKELVVSRADNGSSIYENIRSLWT